ncbi:MAG: alpha/beta hydrolase [Clostridia bacterium]|nr:alpha/beta hydrolase [Clostridia bacterium]
MRVFSVDLKKEYNRKGGNLECYLASLPYDNANDAWKRPAVIVVPGGGYGFVSKREGEPVALEFLARGFHAFVLTYLIGGENGVPYPEQLLELASAVDYVKKHAKEMNVNEKEVFVVGFSAGGHLTGDLAVEYAAVSDMAGRELDCKPTAVGLCYPVISKIHGHQGSYENLLYGYSEEEKSKLLRRLNLDWAVTKETPPAFIWTTAGDTCVPPDNALRFAMALGAKGVPYELHVYPQGEHGKSTGRSEINGEGAELSRIVAWNDDCASFFRLFTEEKF